MKMPNEHQGTLVIRTLFGEISAGPGDNFVLSMEEMTENHAWRELVAAEGGVFCYTSIEREIPF